MSPTLSPNTQAILLLTAPLIAGRGKASPDPLAPGEYKWMAHHLRKLQRQPADLLAPDADDLFRGVSRLLMRRGSNACWPGGGC